MERIEERLFALRGAARKHQITVDALAALAERFAADLAALDAGEARIVALSEAVAKAQTAYAAPPRAFRRRGARRPRSSTRWSTRELKPLKLEGAHFRTEIVSDPETGGPDGYDRVEFWVQTNPGSRPGPLVKVASGGELARFMLALKVVLADRGSAPTLVFDEIDTGVGGAVADAIGQRLARLAERAQVLTVTHAPQVAARASRHLRIAKSAAKGAGGKAKAAGSRRASPSWRRRSGARRSPACWLGRDHHRRGPRRRPRLLEGAG